MELWNPGQIMSLTEQVHQQRELFVSDLGEVWGREKGGQRVVQGLEGMDPCWDSMCRDATPPLTTQHAGQQNSSNSVKRSQGAYLAIWATHHLQLVPSWYHRML